MTNNEIAIQIEKRILEIDETIPEYWPKSFYERGYEDDIMTLEKSYERTKKGLKSTIIFLIILAILLIVGLMVKKYNGIEKLNSDGFVIFIVCTIGLIRGAIKSYSVKIKLENKIFLVRLLNQMSDK